MNKTNPFHKTVSKSGLQKPALSVLTAYDFPSAQIAQKVGVDSILVGDSLANVVLGHSSTRDVGMPEMCLFTSAVRRGAPDIHIISDMPYGADKTPELAIENAQKLIDAGADSVKVEGDCISTLRAMVEAKIPVVGHLGLTPQTAKSYKQVGQSDAEAESIRKAVKAFEEIGLIAFVIEHVPSQLAEEISANSLIPCIGIGAGVMTDAQVMVFHDVLGIYGTKVPPIAHAFSDLQTEMLKGVEAYHQWVKSRTSLKALKDSKRF